MKYLCLAYGDGKDWENLSSEEQDSLLAQDEALRLRGDLVAAVEPQFTTLTAWDGSPSISEVPFAVSKSPLAGFAIIQADSVEDVYRLIANTPCARAHGALEVRLITEINEASHSFRLS